MVFNILNVTDQLSNKDNKPIQLFNQNIENNHILGNPLFPKLSIIQPPTQIN